MEISTEVKDALDDNEVYIVCTINKHSKIAETHMSNMTYDQFMIMFKSMDDTFGRFVRARQVAQSGTPNTTIEETDVTVVE
jgi:hypothetical protein